MAANLQGKGMIGILLVLILFPFIQALCKCNPNATILNGKIQITKECEYKVFCEDGFLTHGDTKVNCSYAVINTYCEKSECKELPNLRNGMIRPSGAIGLKESVTIKCNSGYILLGPKELKCDGNGEWQPYEMLFCMPFECPTMFHFPNGQIDPPELHAPGTMTFTCNKGFKLRGPNMVDCTSNGTWVPNVMPFCERIFCYALSSVKNGAFSPSGEAEIGTNGTLKCKEGFVVDGQKEFYCDESGNWTFPLKPFCKDQMECTVTIGFIVGSVLNGVFCISAIVFSCYVYKRYKRDKRNERCIDTWYIKATHRFSIGQFPVTTPPVGESRAKTNEQGSESEVESLQTTSI